MADDCPQDTGMDDKIRIAELEAEISRLREAAAPIVYAGQGIPTEIHDRKPIANICASASCPGTFRTITTGEMRAFVRAFDCPTPVLQPLTQGGER